MADVRRAAALVVDDRHLVALARRARASCARSCGRSSRRATTMRTIQASSPAAASPCSFVRPYADCGIRRVRLDVRLALPAVEDVVGREVDERRAELGGVLRAADVDRRRLLRVGLGPVDVGPRGRVQHEVGRAERRRRQRHVPLGARQPDAHRRRTPRASAAPSWPPAPVTTDASRWTGSAMSCSTDAGRARRPTGSPCSSGSAGSYSSVTRYAKSASVSASYPCAWMPGT